MSELADNEKRSQLFHYGYSAQFEPEEVWYKNGETLSLEEAFEASRPEHEATLAKRERELVAERERSDKERERSYKEAEERYYGLLRQGHIGDETAQAIGHSLADGDEDWEFLGLLPDEALKLWCTSAQSILDTIEEEMKKRNIEGE